MLFAYKYTCMVCDSVTSYASLYTLCTLCVRVIVFHCDNTDVCLLVADVVFDRKKLKTNIKGQQKKKKVYSW